MTVQIQAYSLDEADFGNLGQRRGGPGGTSALYPIDTGIPGANIRLGFDEVDRGLFSPRHHHNFDQFRLMLEGAMNIEPNVYCKEGELAYIPEGTYYGPFTQEGDATLLVMQWTGPNGGYRPSRPEQKAAAEALVAAGGTFENNVYKGKTPDGRTFNKYGYEATWEQVTGRPIQYADPRQPSQVIMRPSVHRWQPNAAKPGLKEKHLGTFNEFRTSFVMWQLAPNTTLPAETLDAPQVRFVISGDTIYAGRELGPNSVYYVPDGVRSEVLESRNGAELLVISLPMFVRSVWDRVQQEVMEGAMAVAH